MFRTTRSREGRWRVSCTRKPKASSISNIKDSQARSRCLSLSNATVTGVQSTSHYSLGPTWFKAYSNLQIRKQNQQSRISLRPVFGTATVVTIFYFAAPHHGMNCNKDWDGLACWAAISSISSCRDSSKESVVVPFITTYTLSKRPFYFRLALSSTKAISFYHLQLEATCLRLSVLS